MFDIHIIRMKHEIESIRMNKHLKVIIVKIIFIDSLAMFGLVKK